MRKLLFITFYLFLTLRLCTERDSGRHNKEPASRKERQIPFSPKENKRTGLDESQPQQSLQGEQQEEINLHLPPSDYVEPLPWTDMKKIHFQKNIFEWDFQRFADFLLSPEVVLTMYGSHNTYPAMGSIMQAGAGITYYSPDGHWELSGGVYAAHYSISTPSSIAGAVCQKGCPPGYPMGRRLQCLRILPHQSLHAPACLRPVFGLREKQLLSWYMDPMYPQSGYGMVLELKVTDWLEPQRRPGTELRTPPK